MKTQTIEMLEILDRIEKIQEKLYSMENAENKLAHKAFRKELRKLKVKNYNG